ncbi:MAG: AmmeMemoRadiSam system protein A [Chloroflexi bacterium]|nr:AmmeMemoRadiSam system protein A [Chloroflexota bacterium]
MEEKTLHPLVKLAREAVEEYVRTGKKIKGAVTSPEMRGKAGVFVSLKKDGQLRGCIGTFEPTTVNVAEEIVSNAIASATRDPRFPPVTEDELPSLAYSVDVLSKPSPACKEDLDPRKFGVIVQCGWRKGLLLPDLEGVETVEQQIEICRCKANIGPNEPTKLFCFEVKRFK